MNCSACHGQVELCGEPDVAVDIVLRDRLLEPGAAEAVEAAADLDRRREIEALVRVDGDRDPPADRVDGVLEQREEAAGPDAVPLPGRAEPDLQVRKPRSA